MQPEDLGFFLEGIQSAISRISRHMDGFDFDGFINDEKTIDSVVRNLTIIGEAATALSPEFRSAHSEVPWRNMINMRNRLVHRYFDVDLEIVWKTVNEDLPVLEKFTQQLLLNENDQQTPE
mgnify:CR=1 FL=1